jgi:ketosteroid isomerase-like protein
MKSMLTIIFLILAWNCAAQKVNLKQEEEKIVKCWVDWPAKATAGAPEFYFADDAVLTGPKVPLSRGKDEITKFYAAMPKIPGMVIKWNEKPNIIRFSLSGDMAYSIDTLRVSMPDGAGKIQTEISHGIHVWNKDMSGNWRVSLLSIYPKN